MRNGWECVSEILSFKKKKKREMREGGIAAWQCEEIFKNCFQLLLL